MERPALRPGAEARRVDGVGWGPQTPGVSTLRERLADVPSGGTLRWIGLRPARGEAMREVDEARATVGRGLEGDRWRGRANGNRQVSLIQAEHLPVIARLLGREAVPPALVRRNLVVGGVNLEALRRLRFRIGEVVLEGSGACAPCAKMDDALGPGGFIAMMGMGGIVARVLEGGRLRVGDPIEALGWPD